jgi:hypothetical protein
LSAALLSTCGDEPNEQLALDDSVTTREDVPIEVDVLRDDIARLGVPLTLVSVTPASNGNVEIIDEQRVRYTPAADFSGNDAFSYSAAERNGKVHSAEVSVVIVAVNDPPSPLPDDAATNINTAVEIKPLGNDTDIEGDPIVVSGVTTPQQGRASFTADSVTYTPRDNFLGTDSFSYTVSDDSGASASATIRVSVVAVGDAPVAVADSAATNEDQAVLIDVLGNDLVAQGSLTLVSNTDPPNGRAEARNDAKITYTPDMDFHGTDTFTYTIRADNNWEATGDVTVTVRSINDAPFAYDDSTVTGNRAVTIPVLDNDWDLDGDPVRILEVDAPSSGTATANPDGSVRYTPAGAWENDLRFEYTISDTGGLTATAEIRIRYNENCAGTNQHCDSSISNGCETDTATDSRHCGTCGHRCKSGESCEAGVCIASCEEGLADCDGNAANGCETVLADSDQHCGECDKPCTGATFCQEGACVEGCREGLGNCDGNAANGCETLFASSHEHCSGCDLPCGDAQYCAESSCTDCEAQRGDCDLDGSNGCESNLLTSQEHCGSCGNGCDSGYSCDAGSCVLGCAPDTADCDSNPTNGCEAQTLHDPDHCGGCNAPCSDTQFCDGGSCSNCASNTADCDLDGSNGCEANLQTSNTHCGACGNDCSGTQSCVAGVCETVCASGTAECDSNPATVCETQTNSDKLNCGGCDITCSDTEFCNAGSCDTCPDNSADCDANAANQCETALDEKTNCAACGVVCSDLQTCTATGCEDCASGLADCNALLADGCEIDLQTDDSNCGLCGGLCFSPETCQAGGCVE